MYRTKHNCFPIHAWKQPISGQKQPVKSLILTYYKFLLAYLYKFTNHLIRKNQKMLSAFRRNPPCPLVVVAECSVCSGEVVSTERCNSNGLQTTSHFVLFSPFFLFIYSVFPIFYGFAVILTEMTGTIGKTLIAPVLKQQLWYELSDFSPRSHEEHKVFVHRCHRFLQIWL